MNYYFVKVSNKVTDKYDAETYGPLILIKPENKDSKPLIDHEKFHVRQWYSTLLFGTVLIGLLCIVSSWALILFGILPFVQQLLYKFVRPYRKWSEIKAYKIQMASGNYKDISFILNALSNNYDLKIDTSEAFNLLTK